MEPDISLCLYHAHRADILYALTCGKTHAGTTRKSCPCVLGRCSLSNKPECTGHAKATHHMKSNSDVIMSDNGQRNVSLL